jgi:hypothetical protein
MDTAGSLLARIAVIHLVAEARGVDMNPLTLARLRTHGDTSSAEILEIIHADEITRESTVGDKEGAGSTGSGGGSHVSISQPGDLVTPGQLRQPSLLLVCGSAQPVAAAVQGCAAYRAGEIDRAYVGGPRPRSSADSRRYGWAPLVLMDVSVAVWSTALPWVWPSMGGRGELWERFGAFQPLCWNGARARG